MEKVMLERQLHLEKRRRFLNIRPVPFKPFYCQLYLWGVTQELSGDRCPDGFLRNDTSKHDGALSTLCMWCGFCCDDSSLIDPLTFYVAEDLPLQGPLQS